MIPAGRKAVDLVGVARLHGLSEATARKRRPWAEPDHPAPLTRGRPRRGHPRLWDHDQAAAYANGAVVPDLPTPGDPLDLLDLAEAAELAEMAPDTWARYEHAERGRDRGEDDAPLVPAPDDVVFGTPHWFRRTVVQYKADRAARVGKPRGGRPAGSTDGTARAEIGPRVAELVEHAHAAGERVNVSAISRELGVNYSTALRHVHRLTGKRR